MKAQLQRIEAVEPSRCVVLRYEHYVKALAWKSANKYEFNEFVLGNVPLVSTFTSNVQNKVVGSFTERELERGEFLIRAGQKPTSLFLIVEGECTLYTHNSLTSKFIPLKLLTEEEQLAA